MRQTWLLFTCLQSTEQFLGGGGGPGGGSGGAGVAGPSKEFVARQVKRNVGTSAASIAPAVRSWPAAASSTAAARERRPSPRVPPIGGVGVGVASRSRLLSVRGGGRIGGNWARTEPQCDGAAGAGLQGCVGGVQRPLEAPPPSGRPLAAAMYRAPPPP